MYKKLGLMVGCLVLAGTAQAIGTGVPDVKGYGVPDVRGYVECRIKKPVDYDGTIAGAACDPANKAVFGTLCDLVVQAGLAEKLNEPGNLTVFAPTNKAFAAIPPDLLAVIGQDNDVLEDVLSYHVVKWSLDPRRGLLVRKVRTLQGQSVFLSNREYEKNPKVNQSSVDCQAVRTKNGTIWPINSVLMPQYF